MEYTKGEWKVYKGQDGEIVYILAPFPEEHQTKENRNAEVVVVRMMGAWTGGKAEQQANAHLIAAAPIGDELAKNVKSVAESIQVFIKNHCALDVDSEILKIDLYEAFKSTHKGIRPSSFFRCIEKGYPVRPLTKIVDVTRSRFLRGITLKVACPTKL